MDAADRERMAETTDDLDERLLVQAAQADPARFVDLYERHFHRVYAYVIRRTRNREEAEDVTSIVFERALAHLPKFEWRGTPFFAWLYRIAANEIADRREAGLREVRTSPAGEAASAGRAESVEPSIEQELEQASRRDCVERSIDELPADQRRVVLLRFFEERSIRDVARELQRTRRRKRATPGFAWARSSPSPAT